MKRIGLSLMAILLLVSATFAQIITIPSDFTTIQAGINAASDGDTVLVEEGTYIENINFRGKAITVASRFILDGDTAHISKTVIDGSEPVYPDSGSTVTMLLARDTASVLCGFTIQGGTGTGPYGFILGGDLTVYMGGGIIHAGGKIINNIVRDNHLNHSELASGGGIAGGVLQDLDSGSGVNTVVRDNIVTRNSTHTLVHYSAGAGIAMDMNSQFTLVENNELFGNMSTTDAPYKAFGGGMNCGRMTSSTGKAIIRNNFIHDNEVHSKYSFGGGMFYLLLYDSPVEDFHPVEIYNNLIVGNHSDYRGGGACLWYLGIWDYKPPLDPVLMNNTIVNNSAETGSGIFSLDAEVALFNNILWNDASSEGGKEISNEVFKYCAPNPAWCFDVNYATNLASYNNIRDGFEGIGNINQDPMLNPDSFSPDESSTCIGRAVDSVLIEGLWYHAPDFDYQGINRLMASADMELDLGALESPFDRPKTDYDSEHVINVPGEESTIQAAIDAAVDGDTVLVDEGYYYENINFNGKAITVASRYILDSDEAHIAQTVIDGSQARDPDNASVVKFDNCLDTTSILCGFTITGGKGTLDHAIDELGRSGGGIYMYNAGGMVNHNIVTGNSIEEDTDYGFGGGMGIADYTGGNFNTVLRNNLIYNNYTIANGFSMGAGINAFIAGGYILIEDNEVFNNTSTCTASYKALGAGINLHKYFAHSGHMIVRNNNIHHNEALCEASMGGGIYLVYERNQTGEDLSSNVPAEIYNNIISDNYSQDKGGGIGIWNMAPINGLNQKVPDPIISNNTIINNRASDGPGIFNYDAETVLFNNIFWNQLIFTAHEVFNENISYPGHYPKTRNDGIIHAYNNIFKQPLIPERKEAAVNSYLDPVLNAGSSPELAGNSPAIGRGCDSLEIKGTWYHAPNIDFSGNSRPGSVDSFVDLGAYESPFSRIMLSTANLASIDMTGTQLIPPFSSAKLKYILRMPENFDYVNGLIAIPEDALAEMEINHATDIFSENIDDRSTTITVTSSDGSTSKIYQVEFRPLSVDASLSELIVSQGSLDPAFDPGIFTYEVLLPAGTTKVPTISCVTSNEFATVKVVDAKDLTQPSASFRTSSVVVTAQDGITGETYRIVFRVAGVGIEDLNNADGLRLFPNPFSTSATLEWDAQRSIQRIELVNMLGKVVRDENQIDGNTITLNRVDLPSGIYFLKVYGCENYVMKLVIR